MTEYEYGRKLARVLSFAADRHKDAVRKGTDIPYMLHPMETAVIVMGLMSGMGRNYIDYDTALTGALLHDVMEDAGVAFEELKELFGEEVACLVAAVSEKKTEEDGTERPWEVRKQETLDRLAAENNELVKAVSFADGLSNIRAIERDFRVTGDRLWERFNTSDSAKHFRYYRGVLERCAEFAGLPEYDEYERRLNTVFASCLHDDMTDGVLGMAIGDALGNPVQFLPREEVRRHPVTTITGGGPYNTPVGAWTDDSSLALATLESLNRMGRHDLEDIMANFLKWLDGDQFTSFGVTFDVGGTCSGAIHHAAPYNHIPARECGLTGEYANGNGALMRILPMCVYAVRQLSCKELTLAEAVDAVEEVSALTHNHIRSRMACGLYFFMVKKLMEHSSSSLNEQLTEAISEGFSWYEAREGYADELSQHYSWLKDLPAFAALPEEQIPSSGYVVDTLKASMWSLLNESTFEKTLLRAVNLGKDTDSVGAVTGGLAGLYYGEAAIPGEWLNKLLRLPWIRRLCKGGSGAED